MHAPFGQSAKVKANLLRTVYIIIQSVNEIYEVLLTLLKSSLGPYDIVWIVCFIRKQSKVYWFVVRRSMINTHRGVVDAESEFV